MTNKQELVEHTHKILLHLSREILKNAKENLEKVDIKSHSADTDERLGYIRGLLTASKLVEEVDNIEIKSLELWFKELTQIGIEMVEQIM